MRTRKQKLFSLLTVIITTMLTIQLAWGAWVIEQKQTVAKNKVLKTVMIFGDNALRTDVEMSNTSTIINFKTQMIYVLQHAQKVYLEMPLSEMKKKVKSQTDEALKTQKNDVVAVKATGEHKTIAGYDCEKMVMLKNGKEIGELWVTNKLKDKKIREIYQKFFELTGSKEPGKHDAILKGIQEGINKGFPMKTLFTNPQLGSTSTEVISIKFVEKDKSYFMPPKDYKKMEMPKMPAGAPKR